MCDAIGPSPAGEEVRCVVSWPHNIHCGFLGKLRVRWTDSGQRPSDEELYMWDAEWSEFRERMMGTVCDCTGAPHRWEVGCPLLPSHVSEEVTT